MSESKPEHLMNPKFYTHAWYVLFFLLVARLISMIFVPLNDSTEARYGEIARKMLETGNWVTPQHDYGVPFWAKPPLSTWLSAISMKCFGVNEFAARLPELLLSIGVLWLVWGLVKKRSGHAAAMVSILVLSSSMYFFLNAGAVMTDPSLLFCTTLSMVSFWYALNEGSKVWSYLFFAGLGLGLLAKGPIAVVLVGLPIFFWVLLRNSWKALWQKLPWFSGVLVVLIIALPWYLLAENRTPGFLNYFIVGEHLHRFLTPGWTGDKYGMAHHAHWGMIWIYAVAGIFPWSLIGLRWIARYWRQLPELSRENDGWGSYLVISSVAPLVFFTFSSNIIYPYVIPALPAFSMLFAYWWVKTAPTAKSMNQIVWVAPCCGVIFLVATTVFVFHSDWVAKSHKTVINAWKEQHPKPGSRLVYWDYKTQYSAQFYSSGQAMATQKTDTLCRLLSNKKDNYLTIDARYINDLPKSLSVKLQLVKSIKMSGDNLMMFHVPVLAC